MTHEARVVRARRRRSPLLRSPLLLLVLLLLVVVWVAAVVVVVLPPTGAAARRKKANTAAARRAAAEAARAPRVQARAAELLAERRAAKAAEPPRKAVRFSPPTRSGAWDLLEQETVLGDDDLSWRWSKRSFEVCEYLLAERGLVAGGKAKAKAGEKEEKEEVVVVEQWVPKGYCHGFQDIVEDVFDIEGHNMADTVGHWDFDTILGHAEQDAFKSVGYQMTMDVLNWMLNEKVRRWDDIRQAYQSKWIGWMLKVVTGDTQNLGNLPPGFDPVSAREERHRKEWDPTYDAEREAKRKADAMDNRHTF